MSPFLTSIKCISLKIFLYQETFFPCCIECPDAQWENECNNAGDCLDGKCHCDVGFEGYKCQLEPLQDSNMDLIVYGGDSSNPSQKYDLETNNSCSISTFPVDIQNLVSGQAFGHPIG